MRNPLIKNRPRHPALDPLVPARDDWRRIGRRKRIRVVPATRKAYRYTALGLMLLVAYLAQDILNLKWPWLVEMQTDETFKRWTGFLLAGYILHQWSFSLGRLKGQSSPIRLARHTAWGAWAPLVFYIHAHQIGYAYLFLLSTVYLANATIGLLNRVVLGIDRKWFLFGWMVVHVGLSVLLVTLAGYHAFMAFYYQ
jgi:hypothetical protein